MSDNTCITVKLTTEDYKELSRRAKELNQTRAGVARELITAFNKDRIKIQPSDLQRTLYKD